MQTRGLHKKSYDIDNDDHIINSATTAATTLEIDPHYMPETYVHTV